MTRSPGMGRIGLGALPDARSTLEGQQSKIILTGLESIMATPKRIRGLPYWLASQKEEDITNPHYKRSIRYYNRLYTAAVDWRNDEKIAAIYTECQRRRRAGEAVVVDHMVPISHPHVCGLHNEFNLEVIGEGPNLIKSNHHWPDMWTEPSALGLKPMPPHQMVLPV